MTYTLSRGSINTINFPPNSCDKKGYVALESNNVHEGITFRTRVRETTS